MSKFKLSILLMTMLTGNAFAAESTSANFQAGATLNASCVLSVENINIGSFVPASTGDIRLQGNIVSQCSKGVNRMIHFSAGNSNNLQQRTMLGSSGNSDVLKYNIYTDNSYASIWSDGVQMDMNTGRLGGHTDGTVRNESFYISIPLNQYIKPDTYTDSITVTFVY